PIARRSVSKSARRSAGHPDPCRRNRNPPRAQPFSSLEKHTLLAARLREEHKIYSCRHRPNPSGFFVHLQSARRNPRTLGGMLDRDESQAAVAASSIAGKILSGAPPTVR